MRARRAGAARPMRDLFDVTLVGHSLAGMTLPGVAARVSDRIGRLVFISCVVPPHGVSVADVLDTLSPTVAEPQPDSARMQ
jgi:pimeloyl-ACP methyl ester carboxylesterase